MEQVLLVLVLLPAGQSSGAQTGYSDVGSLSHTISSSIVSIRMRGRWYERVAERRMVSAVEQGVGDVGGDSGSNRSDHSTAASNSFNVSATLSTSASSSSVSSSRSAAASTLTSSKCWFQQCRWWREQPCSVSNVAEQFTPPHRHTSLACA